MNNSIVNVPEPINEPIKDYKPNSTEKDSVLATYKNLALSIFGCLKFLNHLSSSVEEFITWKFFLL